MRLSKSIFPFGPIRSFALIAAVAISFACFQLYSWSSGFYWKNAGDAGNSLLVFVSEAVEQAVARFDPIPLLIADDPAFREMLLQGAPSGITDFMNEKLRHTAQVVGASEIFVMDKAGFTIATSNYRDEDSFLGRNFAFRPYFLEALSGKRARFHALGTTSGERGFYFSIPIVDGVEVIGVLAVKMLADMLEQEWITQDQIILIADGNGIVFLSSDPVFRFRALAPLSEEILQQIDRDRQFPMDRLQRLEFSSQVFSQQLVQLEITQPAAEIKRYLAESRPLALPGWHAIVLTPTQPIQSQIYSTVALGALALIAGALVIMLVMQKRASMLQRVVVEQDQRLLLEKRVQERTADLDTANASLRQEVSERRRTEDLLRTSQKELIQAGKLAALGKMSAAISHEINQPLTAIKSYASNAAEYLARSRISEASQNIEHISDMADRMTSISGHLRTFARRPDDRLKSVNLAQVLTELTGLVEPQLKASNATLTLGDLDDDVHILGGQLRLQQVFVNIISNALEAMSKLSGPVIDIQIEVAAETVTIAVRDHGPGLAREAKDQVFDAFFTTKGAESGMGLGLSISHNIVSDFGGKLTADNHPEGGAVFSVTLKRVAAEPGEVMSA